MAKRTNWRKIEDLIRDYKAGRLSPENIEKYEKANGIPMAELIEKAEHAVTRKTHNVRTMGLVDLRKLLRRAPNMKEAEQDLYASYSEMPFKEVLERAEQIVIARETHRELHHLQQRAKSHEVIHRYATESEDTTIVKDPDTGRISEVVFHIGENNVEKNYR